MRYIKLLLIVLLLFNIGFSAVIDFAEKKNNLKIFISDIDFVEEVPFFDPSYVVFSLNGVKDLKVDRLKSSSFIEDFHIIKTSSDIKIVFKLKDKSVKHTLKKHKNGYILSFYRSYRTATKSKKTYKKKTLPETKKEENWVVLKPVKDNVKPIKGVKLTFDPVYHILAKNYFDRSKSKYFRKKVIVIDPGHGGRDPGAIGLYGLVEKDITLKIAKKLKKYLERDGRFIVYLTRKSDKYISPYMRSVYAVRKNADLFISIHCNADKKGRGWGTYIYTLSNKGAKSKLTRMVLNRENKEHYAFIKQITVSKNWYVNKIVAEMALSTTMIEGLNFAYTLKKRLKYITTVKDIDSANFIVLKTPGIPSVLIETAYITSPKDAKLLKNPIFLENFAASIYLAVVDYFYDYDEYIAMKK